MSVLFPRWHFPPFGHSGGWLVLRLSSFHLVPYTATRRSFLSHEIGACLKIKEFTSLYLCSSMAPAIAATVLCGGSINMEAFVA